MALEEAAKNEAVSTAPKPQAMWGKRARRLLVTLVVVLVAGAAVYFGGRYALAAYQLRLAEQALADSDLALARQILESCVQVNPNDGEVHFLLARTCRRLGDLEAWRDHLGESSRLQVAPDRLRMETMLARAQTGLVGPAEKTLHDYLDGFHPEEVLILEALVRGYLETGRLRDAYELARFWIEHHPQDWQAYYLRGQALERRRMVDRAIVDLRRAAELKSDRAEVRLQLAQVLMIDGHFKEAIRNFSEYLKLRPDDKGPLAQLAHCQHSDGDKERALATLEELFRSEPNHAAGLLVRAQIELSSGRPAEALPWAVKAEQAAPYETDITHTLARIHRLLDNASEAERLEKKLADLRDKQSHLEKITFALSANPENVALRAQGAGLLLDLGREDEALKWTGLALQNDPRHTATHQLLASYYEKKGDARRAALHRERAELGATPLRELP